MSRTTMLRVPDAGSQTTLYARYFDEQGVSEETLLEAVSLTYQRADVFIRDALDTFAERGEFRSACKAGCGYCCHTLVSVIPPEAFHVARYLETSFDPGERWRGRARTLAGRRGCFPGDLSHYPADCGSRFLHPALTTLL